MTSLIKKPLVSNGGADEHDVRVVKKALNRIGYYTPYDKVGITHIADAAVFAALREFQRTHELPVTGEDFNCRCWAEPITTTNTLYPDAIRPVYPEAFLIPLLRVRKLYQLWQAWRITRNTDWTLGSHKTQARWGNQLKNRDWTPDQISETIRKGQTFPAPNKINPPNGATRYEYNGRFVVRDNTTKEILQIGKRDYIPSKIE